MRFDTDRLPLWATPTLLAGALLAAGCALSGHWDSLAAPGAAEVAVRVDVGHPGHAISPYLLGTVDGDSATLRMGGFRLRRRGGNAMTRYNWELGNASSSARDWRFANRPSGAKNGPRPGDTKPGGYVDRLIREAKAGGAEMLITIPTIGWVAKNRDTGSRSINVPEDGGDPHPSFGPDGIPGYNPRANQRRTSVRSSARKGSSFSDRPNLRDGVVYQDEWVHHLVKTHGAAGKGGVRYYAMDNEPALWPETHTDIHPIRPDYDEVLSRFLKYADAVKSVDPGARITGPVSWGWTAYLHSARDKGDDNYRTAADRQAHGNLPFLQWFLRESRKHDEKIGRRTLDVLDVHFYPQGKKITGDGTDPDVRARRLRSVRGLWDPTYKDESWIGKPVKLIPLLKEWIAKEYPGTRIGITEWTFGAEDDITGALATADALGVFAREGIELSVHWRGSKPGTRTFEAFRLFGNYNGQGARFGGRWLPVQTSLDPDLGSVYAAMDANGEAILVLINKSPDRALPLAVELAGMDSPRVVHAYTMSAKVRRLSLTRHPRVVAGKLRTRLSPYSATVVRVKNTGN